MRGDPFGDVAGVFLDPPEERRAPGVLPLQTEEVQAGRGRDAAAVPRPPALLEDRDVDPGVVDPVARSPHDGVDRQAHAVAERHLGAGRGDGARMQAHPAAAEAARGRADQRLAVLQPRPEPRLHRLAHQARCLEVAKQVAAQDALRQRGLARADREMDLARSHELLGDLKPRVATADHEHPSRREPVRVAVLAAVELDDLRVQPARDRRDHRNLERAGGDHHLIRLVRPVLELDDVAVARLADGGDAAVELDRQVARVLLQVGHDLVARRIVLGVAGERHARQAVVAHGREEDQRVPALAPRGGRGGGGFEDREVAPLFGEQVTDREAGLASPDDDDVAAGGHAVTSKLNIIPLSWCSAMWQCAIQRPTFVTSRRMSTVSPVLTSTVSLQTRFGSTSPLRTRVRNRPAPWTWNGWCIGWSESISFTRRTFTRSPTRSFHSIARFSAPVDRSTIFQRMFAGVVNRLTSTMSSSHSMPPAASCPWS